MKTENKPEKKPMRTSYSREEITSKMNDWMLKNWGRPTELNQEDRDRWMEKNGIIYSFLVDSFPETKPDA